MSDLARNFLGASPSARPIAGLKGNYRLLDAESRGEAVLYQENFLASADCDLLLRYFEANADKRVKTSGEAAFFDSRFIQFSGIPAADRACKSIMHAARGRIAEMLRQFYREPGPLYSDTIQLVKWLPGQPMPPHADNAHPSGEPHPTPFRHFASVVYLNDDYIGGYLYFTRLKLALTPKKGALIAFRGDMAHQHGVTEVLDGVRYTMPAWYTRDIGWRDTSPVESD